MQIEIIGKSNASPDAGGACSGYLIGESGYRLLLDCGHGVLPQLRRTHGVGEPDAILISHLHADHFLDLVPYSHALMHVAGEPPAPIPVYGPPGLRRLLRRLAKLGIGDAIPDAFTVREYDPARTLTLGPLTVSFHAVPHFVTSYACRIQGPEVCVTYGADCRFNEPLARFAAGSDLLILEATAGTAPAPKGRGAGHMTAAQAGELGRLAGVPRLLLTHFSDELDRAALAAAADATFGAPVQLARAGSILRIAPAVNSQSRSPQRSVSRSPAVADILSQESTSEMGATMFKGKKADDVEATEAAEETTKKVSPVKGVAALLGLLLAGAGAALAVSKPLREKALDKLFGAEEQFDYTPPADADAEQPGTPADPAV